MIFSAFCLLASSAILYYVLKFRVHIRFNVTLEYTPTSSRTPSVARKGRRAERSVGADASTAKTRPAKFVPVASNLPERNSGLTLEPQSARVSDITSALVNLGAAKKPSEQAAKQAVREHPDASFDIQFSVALQGVRNAA